MPVVAFTAGSFGDILQVAGLAIKLAKGLYNSAQTKANQRQIIEDLNGLAHVLLTAEQVASRAVAELGADQPLLSLSLDSLRIEVQKCHIVLQLFIADLEKLQKPFSVKDVRGTWGKVQWVLNENNFLAEVQKRVENHTRNIHMFLSTMNMLGITAVSTSISRLALAPPQPSSTSVVNESASVRNPSPSRTVSQDPSTDTTPMPSSPPVNSGDSLLKAGQAPFLSNSSGSLALSKVSPPQVSPWAQCATVEQFQFYHAIPRTLLGRDCIQDMEELRDRLFTGYMSDEDFKRLESPVDTIFELLYNSSHFEPKDLERFCFRILYYLGLGATKLATKADVFWTRYGKYAVLFQEQAGGSGSGDGIQIICQRTISDLFAVRDMYEMQHWGIELGGGIASLVELAASVLLLVSCYSSSWALLHSIFQYHFDDETGCWRLGRPMTNGVELASPFKRALEMRWDYLVKRLEDAKGRLFLKGEVSG